MDIRISLQTRLSRQSDYLRRQSNELARLQEQASSGLRIQRPSDDPVASAQLMRLRAEGSRRDAHLGNISAVRSRLDQANSQLLDAHGVLTRARELALEAANEATDASSFEVLATEVDHLLDRALSLANSRAEGRALFGGTATGQDPFVVTARDAGGRPTAVAYQGADGRASAEVGQGQQVDMLYPGDRVFQQPGRDVFQALMGLRDLLRNTGGLAAGPQRQALSQQAGAVEQAQAAVLEASGEMSAGLESLAGLEGRLGELQLQHKIDISNLESADLADVVVRLAAQRTLLDSTLSVTARSFDQNLFDLLR